MPRRESGRVPPLAFKKSDRDNDGMRRPLLILATLVLFGTAAVGWVLLMAVPEEPPASERTLASPGASELRQLQIQADAACLCDRGRDVPWTEECWAAFDRRIAQYEYTETGTMCMQESVSLVCFGPPNAGGTSANCVFRQRMYGACSADETRERQAQARTSGSGGCG